MSRLSEAVRDGLDELARVRDEIAHCAAQRGPDEYDVAVDFNQLEGWRDAIDSVSDAIEGAWES